MNKYRKKPIVVEAFQMTGERRQDNSEWPEWLHEAWNKDPGDTYSLDPYDYPNSDGTDKLVIGTHEPEVNATYDYLKIYEYHKPNYYNIKLNLFDYIIKNSRMRKVKCVYDSQKGSEIKNLHRQKES